MIVVGHDLTDDGDVALELARGWGDRLRFPVKVVHVLPEGARPEMLFPQTHMRDALKAIDRVRDAQHLFATKLRDSETLEIREGSPGEQIVEVARDAKAELIVLGGHEPGEKRVFGSAAEKVLAHAHLPVMIARRHFANGRILTALALEQEKEPQLDVALRIAKTLEGVVTVTHILRDDEEVSPETAFALRRAQELLPKRCEIVLERGDPAAAIVAVAERTEAEMIVVGTHARTGLARFVTGSVASAVVRRASCSVLVVPLRG
jgi:nucleotide-binding universal stress UspA family protein